MLYLTRKSITKGVVHFTPNAVYTLSEILTAVSKLEKTIVYNVSKPYLCGGRIEVEKALFESGTKIDYQKLFDYLSRNDMQVTKKRYLFLSNLLGLLWFHIMRV